MSAKSVLVYWLEEKRWSIVRESAVKGDAKLGLITKTKFQGKFYPSIVIASKYIYK